MTDAPAPLDPGHTALLVMDFQVGVVSSLADAGDLLARTADAIATVRRHGGRIGYVRAAFEDRDFAAVPVSNKIFARLAGQGDEWHSESPATAVHGDLAPQAGDIVVRKTRVGAFSTTDLDAQLRDHGITTVILAGISTSGVVLSTVREAADRDYRVVVLADAAADREPDVHEFLTRRIFPRQADVIAAAELDALLAPAVPDR